MSQIRTDSIRPKEDLPKSLSDLPESRYQVGCDSKRNVVHDESEAEASINKGSASQAASWSRTTLGTLMASVVHFSTGNRSDGGCLHFAFHSRGILSYISKEADNADKSSKLLASGVGFWWYILSYHLCREIFRRLRPIETAALEGISERNTVYTSCKMRAA